MTNLDNLYNVSILTRLYAGAIQSSALTHVILSIIAHSGDNCDKNIRFFILKLVYITGTYHIKIKLENIKL